MLDKNWTPRLIKWLRLRDRPTLQVEALWALTNIAAGATDNTSVLLQNGVIPTLVSLLDSSNEEASVWGWLVCLLPGISFCSNRFLCPYRSWSSRCGCWGTSQGKDQRPGTSYLTQERLCRL